MQRAIAVRALATSARSFERCLRNTVNKTILRPPGKKNVMRCASLPRSNRSSEQPLAQRPRVRHPERRTPLDQAVYVERSGGELGRAQTVQPSLYLGLQLDRPL